MCLWTFEKIFYALKKIVYKKTTKNWIVVGFAIGNKLLCVRITKAFIILKFATISIFWWKHTYYNNSKWRHVSIFIYKIQHGTLNDSFWGNTDCHNIIDFNSQPSELYISLLWGIHLYLTKSVYVKKLSLIVSAVLYKTVLQ